MLARRHLEVCVFSQLAAELRSGDVAVTGSDSNANLNSQLMSWEEYVTNPNASAEFGALGFYRALPTTSAQLTDAVRRARLTVPTTAIGAHPVGRALENQLRPVTDDLTGHLIEDCGHIVPLDRPDELLAAIAASGLSQG